MEYCQGSKHPSIIIRVHVQFILSEDGAPYFLSARSLEDGRLLNMGRVSRACLLRGFMDRRRATDLSRIGDRLIPSITKPYDSAPPPAP